MVGSNDTRNAGSRKRNIRLEPVMDLYGRLVYLL